MSQSRGLLVALLLLYGVIGTLFAIRTPAWQAPDEPAHYNYVAQLAQNGCCPVLEMGDWDSPYLEALKSARFAPDLLGNLPAIQYEDHQPPLYYGLLSLVFNLTGGSLTPCVSRMLRGRRCETCCAICPVTFASFACSSS